MWYRLLTAAVLIEMTELSDWDRPRPFTMDVVVQAAETDRLGHTNNVSYLRWTEDISWQHIEPLGMGWSVQEKLGKAMAIVHTEVDYLQASYAGDELILGTWITELDRRLGSSRAFQLRDVNSGETLLRAIARYICIDLKSGRPSRMPEAFVSAHQQALKQWQDGTA